MLSQLRDERSHACRLTPDRALETLDDAHGFLRDRGLLTRNPNCTLPSLFGACHEEPYKAGAGGFGEWPSTKWPWSFELAALPGRRRPEDPHGQDALPLGGDRAPRRPDRPRRAVRLAEAEPGWARLLAHLAEAGPATPDDLRTELGLARKELKDCVPRSSVAAWSSRGWIRATSGEMLYRWDQLVPEAGGAADLAPLVVAAVRAAVVVPEKEPRRWFSWRWRWEDGLIDGLVEDGELSRPEPGWLSAGPG